jgi:uncharacterized protein YndB with AHSA1/START domain
VKIDPTLDLVLERTVDVPPDLVWLAWTRPEHVKAWFAPAPWTTVDCDIDLRPGGAFRTVMRSPEGQEFPSVGCYLEIVPERKLVWTSALEPGFRPAPRGPGVPFLFTAVIALEPHEGGTRYTAIAMHQDEKSRAEHDAMGFRHGWGAALEQLVEHMKQSSAAGEH